MIDAAELPDDVAALRRIIVAQSAELAAAKAGLVSKTRPGEVGVFVDPNRGRDRGPVMVACKPERRCLGYG